jgi:hypothetical protein
MQPQFRPRQLRPWVRRLAVVVRGTSRLVRSLVALLTSAPFIFVSCAPFVLWTMLLLQAQRDRPDLATPAAAAAVLHSFLLLWAESATLWAVFALVALSPAWNGLDRASRAGWRRHAISVFLAVAALFGVMLLEPRALPAHDAPSSSTARVDGR